MKLPELKRRVADQFLDEFAPGHSREGNIVTGDGRAGSYTLHLRHDGGFRPDQLSRALRYLGVDRDEFMEWYQNR